MKLRRRGTTMLAAAVLATAAPADARSHRVDLSGSAGRAAGRAVAAEAAIAIGAGAVAIGLIGALWYYLHERHARAAEVPAQASNEDVPAPR